MFCGSSITIHYILMLSLRLEMHNPYLTSALDFNHPRPVSVPELCWWSGCPVWAAIAPGDSVEEKTVVI